MDVCCIFGKLVVCEFLEEIDNGKFVCEGYRETAMSCLVARIKKTLRRTAVPKITEAIGGGRETYACVCASERCV
jgi:hypothetical protein